MTDWTVRYLRHVLEQTKWSANELAHKADVAASTITRPAYQKDYHRALSARTVSAVAEASGISTEGFAPRGFSENRTAFSDPKGQPVARESSGAMAAGIADPAANIPLNAISVTVLGDVVSIVARVDRSGLARLRAKLDALVDLLDD